MKEIIWSLLGVVIGIAAAVYMVRLLMLKYKGVKVNAEVTAAKEVKKDNYVHTMKYIVDGEYFEADDKAGFTQPFEVGSFKTIIYDKKKPEYFEFEDEINKNVIVMGIMIVLAVIFTIKFLLSGLK